MYSINVTGKLKKEIQERGFVEDKLRVTLEELESLSLSDELTGLYNRRGFITLAEQSLKQCIRGKRSSMICFIDMDGLKPINDTFGHKEGDRALKGVTHILQLCFRDIDIIARLGGDEFALFLSNADDTNVPSFRERLKGIMAHENEIGNYPLPLSISLGICHYEYKHFDTVEKMLKAADEAMYLEKKDKKDSRTK